MNKTLKMISMVAVLASGLVATTSYADDPVSFTLKTLLIVVSDTISYTFFQRAR